MSINGETSTNSRNSFDVHSLENLWSSLSQKEKEELGGVFLGKMENLFRKRLESCVTVGEDSDVGGWGGKVFSIELPEVGNFKSFNFKGLVSYNCPNHPYPDWEDEKGDIYKYIYEGAEIEELIREIRQYKKESGFYVNEDCFDIFKTPEAKSLAGIIEDVIACSDGYGVHYLWVKDKNGEVCNLYLSSSYGFSGPGGRGDNGRLLVHTSDVNKNGKIE